MINKALSQFVSAALIILLSIIAISLILTALNPVIDKSKDSAILNEALQNLGLIDNNVREVVSGGEDSKRTINIKVSDGTYRVDSENDQMNFTYDIKADLNIGGQRDDVNITLDGKTLTLFIKYDNIDIQGSDHFSKGDNSVVILHNGTNSTLNKPIIHIGR
jgi:hypothetical protein